jgi:hypothetical protein
MIVGTNSHLQVGDSGWSKWTVDWGFSTVVFGILFALRQVVQIRKAWILKARRGEALPSPSAAIWRMRIGLRVAGLAALALSATLALISETSFEAASATTKKTFACLVAIGLSSFLFAWGLKSWIPMAIASREISKLDHSATLAALEQMIARKREELNALERARGLKEVDFADFRRLFRRELKSTGDSVKSRIFWAIFVGFALGVVVNWVSDPLAALIGLK